MRSARLVIISLAMFIGANVVAAERVEAIPVLANGQGVSCSQCHSAPPNLNPYGRYIMVTNFSKVLNAHAQMRENLSDPVSAIAAGNGTSAADPNISKFVLGLLQLNSAGYLGQDVTYYASVPIVDGGFPAAGVDQLWGAYNGFFHGNGSLQVGDFPTPMFAPWLSQSMSLAGYALAAMPVGLNAVGIGDNRWGASYTQIGSNGLIANVAYMTNEGPLERAYDTNVNNSTSAAVGESWVASLQQMNLVSHFTGGVAAMAGTFPLPSGAQDSYNRALALASYSTSPDYSLIAMSLIGHDSNPNDGATPSSGSNGWSLESIVTPIAWLHLDGRYERTNDGLGTVQSNYVGDIAFSIMPNLVVTLENVSSVGTTAVTSYQLLWAAPWIQHRGAAQTVAVTSPGPQGLALGETIYAADCAQCHGAHGGGGVGPNLHGIAMRKSLGETVAFIENPSGIMPKLFPATLSAVQVQEVATFIRDTFR
jgi:mono/diheme cytochrome c family protein